MFRVLDVLTVKRATGDFPEECLFLLDSQLMFLKKEEEPTTKMFDEWIGSLTEEERVAVDTPEGQVTCGAPDDTSQDQQVDLQKVCPF